MPKLFTAAALASAFTARYTQTGTVDLAASGQDQGVKFPDVSVDSIQAVGVRTFTAPGKQVYVKVLDHFLVLGETVQAGEYVELPEIDAKYLVNQGRAQIATAEEVAAAQKTAKAGK